MLNIIDRLMACYDCMELVANGEPSEARPDLESEIARHLDLQPLQHLYIGDQANDNEFSWRPCDCCGSPLGGARFEIVLAKGL